MENSELGRIIESNESEQIRFVSKGYFKERFVKVPMPHIDSDGYLLAEVIKVESNNDYFNQPRDLRTLSNKEKSIKSQVLFISTARVLGYIHNGRVENNDFPPLPSEPVLSARESEVKKILGLLENQGVEVGTLKKAPKVTVTIDIDSLTRTHFSILGRTGSGKSVFTQTLINNSKSVVDFIIFSPTSEYNQLGSLKKINVYTENDILLPLNARYISSLTDISLGGEQILDDFVNSKLEENKLLKLTGYDLSNMLMDWVESKQAKRKQAALFPEHETKTTKLPNEVGEVVSKLRQLRLNFSNQPMQVPFVDSTIFDLSGMTLADQEIIVGYVSGRLFKSYKSKKGKKILVIVEEAHNYAPSVLKSHSKNQLVQISREGRKLGISLCIISQRPRHIDQTILSQCSNLFLFHLPHPDDLQHVLSFAPNFSIDMVNSVRGLGVGECMIIGDLFTQPLVCKVKSIES